MGEIFNISSKAVKVICYMFICIVRFRFLSFICIVAIIILRRKDSDGISIALFAISIIQFPASLFNHYEIYFLNYESFRPIASW